ncbi:MAG: ABC transporter permease [Thalassobaculum sp.]
MADVADFWLLFVLTLDATIRVAAPLILCSMAGLFSERSGVVDIGLEGKMLAGAFAAGAAAYVTGSAWIGLLAAMTVSTALAMLHGFACITHRGDQVVSGVAINVLVAGLTIVLGIAWFSQGGQTPSLPADARFQSLTWPLADTLRPVPVLGTLYAEIVSGHNILVYVAVLSVPFTWWVVYRTRFGLRLRAVGESPSAVDTAGISVTFLRYRALLFTGTFCGIAGAYLSTAQSAAFVRDMTAGKGYIALAALIFGKWRPVPALLACLLFGFLDAVATRLQGVEIPGIGQAPVALIQALPYALTVILLAGFIGKAIAPKAIGRPYVKER